MVIVVTYDALGKKRFLRTIVRNKKQLINSKLNFGIIKVDDVKKDLDTDYKRVIKELKRRDLK